MFAYFSFTQQKQACKSFGSFCNIRMTTAVWNTRTLTSCVTQLYCCVCLIILKNDFIPALFPHKHFALFSDKISTFIS